MQSDSGRTTSLWMATAAVPAYPALARDLHADVCIVGAGISGLSVAYHLTRAGKKVVVIDDGPIGGGESGRTTAHFTNALDDRYYELERLFGVEKATLAANSHTAAINRVAEIVRLEGIDCDFEHLDGWLFLGGDDSRDVLEKELEACHRAGLVDVRLVERAPVKSFDTGPALQFPYQAQLHILKYLSGLARAIARDGGEIYCGSHVSEIEDGAPAHVKTEDGRTVTADALVIATNSPVNDWVTMHTKQAAYRTYVVGARVPRGSVEKGLYWDTPDPYHYVRVWSPPNQSHDVLVVGGEDHKTGQEMEDYSPEERFRCLEEWTRARFASAGARIAQWSGQVMETHDYLAFTGKNPDGAEHVWLHTGDSGMGMTHGTVAGLLLPTLLEGKPHHWAREFDPKRVTLHRRELGTLAKENADVALQYGDYVTPGQVDDVESIPAGEGRVIRRGAHKIAVYKDDAGRVHERSAACTHVKCIVDWNTAEKSWDCPCHGSRFDPFGKVLNGPAIEDLHPAP